MRVPAAQRHEDLPDTQQRARHHLRNIGPFFVRERLLVCAIFMPFYLVAKSHQIQPKHSTLNLKPSTLNPKLRTSATRVAAKSQQSCHPSTVCSSGNVARAGLERTSRISSASSAASRAPLIPTDSPYIPMNACVRVCVCMYACV